MLRRSVTGRLVMACYAVWVALALVVQDATPCPTHDGPAAAAVAMATMPATMHMGAAAGAAHSHGSSHHVCTCVGCGCCVAALDLRGPSPAAVPAPAVVVRGAAAPLAPFRIEPPRVDRRLPFANAPPTMVNAAV
jgi:hypothetical protein